MTQIKSRITASALALAIAAAPITGYSDDRMNEVAHQKNVVLNGVLSEINDKYELIYQHMPKNALKKVAMERKNRLNFGIERRVARMKNGKLDKNTYRVEALKQNYRATREQKKELSYQIQNFDLAALDRIAEKMEGQPQYLQALANYRAAYSQKEKAKALSQAVFEEIDTLFSMKAKRASIMSKEALVRDLRQSQTIMNTKLRKKEKILLYVGLAVLTVGAASLISWGVAEGVYYGKYKKDAKAYRNKRRSELDGEFSAIEAELARLEAEVNNHRSQLEQEYNGLFDRLTQEENQYLNEQGFVYTTCAVYQKPGSYLCNNYNYRLFSGSQTCTVNCYKDARTGRETFHEAPTCTQPYIPADCYDPSEYWDGYDAGFDDGFFDGYDDGVFDGEDQGAYDGDLDGYNDGFDDGYDYGYNDGFDDGYDDYYYVHGSSVEPEMSSREDLFDSPINVSTLNRKKMKNYGRGYEDGLRDAFVLLNIKR